MATAISRSKAPEPEAPERVATVLEVAGPAGWTQPHWAAAWPWLVQGTTDAASPGDLGLFGDAPVGATLARWRRLRERCGLPRAVHARQVHGARVLTHGPGPAGVAILDDADGHVTAEPGVLLTISIADCVPVFLVDPQARRVALLHAGWRGTAAGVLEAGVAALAAGGSPPARLAAHLGPAICGACYEVGEQVLRALGLPGADRARLDLRAVLAARVLHVGIPAERVTRSDHCTRHGGTFFSHRGGQAGRQMACLGVRAGAAEAR